MTQRSLFFAGLASAALGGASKSSRAASGPPMRLGYNTYCIRAMQWHDDALLQFAVDHKAGRDPGAMDPKHWAGVKARKTELETHRRLIGIGAAAARRPLPHHRAYGSDTAVRVGYPLATVSARLKAI